MKKLGIIGIGNIAQKAYLPVYEQLRDQYEWHIVSRHEDQLTHLKQRYGFKYGHTSVEKLIEEKPSAVFVHTPTSSHYQIVKELLQSDINVYVDKPISENYQEVEELFQIAKNHQMLLTCGFNRRFVPVHQEMKDIGLPQRVFASKVRQRELQEPKFAVYDLLIHVVDLVQFELNSDKAEYVGGRITLTDDQQSLKSAEITMQSDQGVGTALIEMQTGVNSESILKISNRGVLQAKDCQELTHTNAENETITRGGDWQRLLITRGFEPLVNEFLDAVVNKNDNPVSEKSVLSSHWLCSRLLEELKVIK